jgi:hypothetical protein
MLHSFARDWARWSVSERLAVKLASFVLAAAMATWIGPHLI